MYYLITRNMNQMDVKSFVPAGWMCIGEFEELNDAIKIMESYNEAKRTAKSDTRVVGEGKGTDMRMTYQKGDWRISYTDGGQELAYYTGAYYRDDLNRLRHMTKRFYRVRAEDKDGYVILNKNKELLYYVGNLSAKQCCTMIEDIGVFTADYRSVGDGKAPTSYHRPRTALSVKWSIEYDGMHVMVLMARHPKMPFGDIVSVITNEGGSIDSNGIIHRGE